MKSSPLKITMVKMAGYCFALLASTNLPAPAQVPTTSMSREQVIADGEKMADAQLATFKGRYWGRFWVDGVMWAGFADFSKVSAKTEYMEAMQKMGKGGKWELILEPKLPYHADDFCIGQAYLDVYEQTKDPKILENIKLRVGQVSDVILSDEMAQKYAKVQELPWNEGLTWSWCDALFMAAPLFAHLSAITGDPKYLQAMDLEWKRNTDLLYDKEEHLSFRDKNFIQRKTKFGKKVFWTRGNGWVMAALARMLPYVPKDDPHRTEYIEEFKALSARLASLQRPDGTWSPSLLDYESLPYSETSGTGLNCFAMAWGINNKILDEKTYRPVVEKAWAALLAARLENGLLGYVQGVGAEPRPVHASQSIYYGTGAFLMAAAQVAQMAPLNLPPAPQLTAAPEVPKAPKP